MLVKTNRYMKMHGETINIEISVTYSDVCSVREPAFQKHAPYYIVVCGLSSSTIFLHSISRTARFCGEKK